MCQKRLHFHTVFPFWCLFPPIRYLLFHFPILSALVGVSTNFIFLSLIFLLSYARLLFTDGKTAKQVREATFACKNT